MTHWMVTWPGCLNGRFQRANGECKCFEDVKVTHNISNSRDNRDSRLTGVDRANWLKVQEGGCLFDGETTHKGTSRSGQSERSHMHYKAAVIHHVSLSRQTEGGTFDPPRTFTPEHLAGGELSGLAHVLGTHLCTHTSIDIYLPKNDTRDKSSDQTSTEQEASDSRAVTVSSTTNKHNENSIRSASWIKEVKSSLEIEHWNLISTCGQLKWLSSSNQTLQRTPLSHTSGFHIVLQRFGQTDRRTDRHIAVVVDTDWGLVGHVHGWSNLHTTWRMIVITTNCTGTVGFNGWLSSRRLHSAVRFKN